MERRLFVPTFLLLSRMKSRHGCLGNPSEKDEWLFNPDSGFSCHSGLMENNGRQRNIAVEKSRYFSVGNPSFIFICDGTVPVQLSRILSDNCPSTETVVVSYYIVYTLSVSLRRRILYILQLNRNEFNKRNLAGNFCADSSSSRVRDTGSRIYDGICHYQIQIYRKSIIFLLSQLYFVRNTALNIHI